MNDQARHSPPIAGSIRALDATRGAVRMESVYETDAADLWSAITNPDRLARWVARIEGDLQPGGSFSATFTSGWQGQGRVDVCEPPQHLLVTLAPGTDDETVIEAVLTGLGARTRLVIEERGIPLTEIDLHGAGWQVHTEDLHHHLAGRARPDWQTRWQELTPNKPGPD